MKELLKEVLALRDELLADYGESGEAEAASVNLEVTLLMILAELRKLNAGPTVVHNHLHTLGDGHEVGAADGRYGR